MQTIDDVSHKLQNAYSELGNWRAVGAAFGISSGLAWRIAKERYEPKDPQERAAVGLPALALAPVCDRCGVVHVARRCPRPYRLPGRLRDWPPALLRWSFEHREVIQ